MKNDWYSQIMNEITDKELLEIFQEIIVLRETGIIKENTKLQKLNKKFQECPYKDVPLSEIIHITEYKVLFEMSQRYFDTMIDG